VGRKVLGARLYECSHRRSARQAFCNVKSREKGRRCSLGAREAVCSCGILREAERNNLLHPCSSVPVCTSARIGASQDKHSCNVKSRGRVGDAHSALVMLCDREGFWGGGGKRSFRRLARQAFLQCEIKGEGRRCSLGARDAV